LKPAIEFEPRRGTTIRLSRGDQKKLVEILRSRNRDLPADAPAVTMAKLVREWVSDDYRRLCDARASGVNGEGEG
jgi:hypothetical protein